MLGTEYVVELSDFVSRDLTQKLSGNNSINISETMFKLNGIAITGQEVLEKSAEALSCLIFVDLEMVEVATGSSVPLKEIAGLVLNGAIRSHTHLYDWK